MTKKEESVVRTAPVREAHVPGRIVYYTPTDEERGLGYADPTPAMLLSVGKQDNEDGSIATVAQLGLFAVTYAHVRARAMGEGPGTWRFPERSA